VYLGFLIANNTPTALGFDTAQGGFGLGAQMAKPGTMRYLVEPVFRGNRSYFYRLKQD